MTMHKIKKGDDIIVIAGKDKGHQGKVLRVNWPDKKVLIEGAGIVKKHVKPNPNNGTQGGIVEKEAPIALSNVAILNPVTSKRDRVGIKTLEDGRKVRYYKSNGEDIDV